VNGFVRIDTWYDAFAIQATDKLHVEKNERAEVLDATAL